LTKTVHIISWQNRQNIGTLNSYIESAPVRPYSLAGAGLGEEIMSRIMYWRVPVPQTYDCLSFELKKAVARRYWDHEGLLSGNWIILQDDEIPYLQGIADAGIPDVEKLIELIRKHKIVEISLIGERSTNVR
jgi:hypothetical protein